MADDDVVPEAPPPPAPDPSPNEPVVVAKVGEGDRAALLSQLLAAAGQKKKKRPNSKSEAVRKWVNDRQVDAQRLSGLVKYVLWHPVSFTSSSIVVATLTEVAQHVQNEYFKDELPPDDRQIVATLNRELLSSSSSPTTTWSFNIGEYIYANDAELKQRDIALRGGGGGMQTRQATTLKKILDEDTAKWTEEKERLKTVILTESATYWRKWVDDEYAFNHESCQSKKNKKTTPPPWGFTGKMSRDAIVDRFVRSVVADSAAQNYSITEAKRVVAARLRTLPVDCVENMAAKMRQEAERMNTEKNRNTEEYAKNVRPDKGVRVFFQSENGRRLLKAQKSIVARKLSAMSENERPELIQRNGLENFKRDVLAWIKKSYSLVDEVTKLLEPPFWQAYTSNQGIVGESSAHTDFPGFDSIIGPQTLEEANVVIAQLEQRLLASSSLSSSSSSSSASLAADTEMRRELTRLQAVELELSQCRELRDAKQACFDAPSEDDRSARIVDLENKLRIIQAERAASSSAASLSSPSWMGSADNMLMIPRSWQTGEHALPRCTLTKRTTWVMTSNLRATDRVLATKSGLTQVERTYCWGNVWIGGQSGGRAGDRLIRRANGKRLVHRDYWLPVNREFSK